MLNWNTDFWQTYGDQNWWTQFWSLEPWINVSDANIQTYLDGDRCKSCHSTVHFSLLGNGTCLGRSLIIDWQPLPQLLQSKPKTQIRFGISSLKAERSFDWKQQSHCITLQLSFFIVPLKLDPQPQWKEKLNMWGWVTDNRRHLILCVCEKCQVHVTCYSILEFSSVQ